MAEDFKATLASYQQAIDRDIAVYATHVHKTTLALYGKHPTAVTDAFLDMLARGGKRLRGSLVMTGYYLLGGTDHQMIVRAATAIEMVHAHLLILDDVFDRSDLRRGKPTAHKILESYHQSQGMHGSAAHTGTSLAINAASLGVNAAQMLIAGLQADPELRSKALGIISHAVMTTAHGQTQDYVQEALGTATREDVEHVMEWKTAYYTILNPLCVGMVLAGADCHDTDAIRAYALHAGAAFQITDDILGVFGDEQAMGKDPLSDIREGKQTLLTTHALEYADTQAKAFLKRCLGNNELSVADFKACQKILKQSGALAFAKSEVDKHTAAALTALQHAPTHWKTVQVTFLKEHVKSFANRAA